MHRTDVWTLGLLACLLSVSSGCVEGEDEPWEAEIVTEPLLIDTNFDGVTGSEEGVVWHGDPDWESGGYTGGINSCTGVLLKTGPNDWPVMLTAAHCLVNNGQLQTDNANFGVVYDTASNTTVDASKYRSYGFSEVYVKSFNEVVEHNDLALVVLNERPLKSDGTPVEGVSLLGRAPIAGTGLHSATPGDEAHALGTGCRFGPLNSFGKLPDDNKRRVGRTAITGFDPAGMIDRYWEVHNGTELRYGAMLCNGDSGGPLYVRDQGELKLAGIASGSHLSPHPTANWDWGSVRTLWAPVFSHTNNNNFAWIQNRKDSVCGSNSFDGNNTKRSATTLHRTTPRQAMTLRNRSVNCALDEDYYDLNLLDPSKTADIRLYFEHSVGDVDLEVFSGRWIGPLVNGTFPASPRRNDDEWSASPNIITSSYSYGNTEKAVHQNAFAYERGFARVYTVANDTNNNYTIVRCDDDGFININQNASETLNNSQTTGYCSEVQARTVCPGEPKFFKFTYWQGATNINVDFLHGYGDIDAQILKDDGSVLVTQQSITDDEYFANTGFPSSMVDGATYYLKVYGYESGLNKNANTFDITICQ